MQCFGSNPGEKVLEYTRVAAGLMLTVRVEKLLISAKRTVASISRPLTGNAKPQPSSRVPSM